MKLIRQPVYDLNQRPFMVIWEITQACDLACKHCRAEAHPEHDAQALSFKAGCDLIDQVEALGKPYPMFILTGGDPFKHPRLFELIAYATGKGLPVAISPSGTQLLNRENLTRAKELGVRAISLSLDASTARLNDEFRQVEGTFDSTVNGWRIANELGLKVQINTTVTRYNLHDLPDMFKLVHDEGLMTWSLFFLVPTGRGLAEDEISPQDYEAVMNFLYDSSKFVGAKATEGHHYKRVVLQRNALEKLGLPHRDVMGLNDTYDQLSSALQEIVTQEGIQSPKNRMRRAPMHINSGEGFVFISLKGDVFPSGYLPMKVGNIKEQSLGEIYSQSHVMKNLRDKSALKGRCGICEFKTICGGSRSRAYAVSGDILSEEPYCVYQPGSFEYMDEISFPGGSA